MWTRLERTPDEGRIYQRSIACMTHAGCQLSDHLRRADRGLVAVLDLDAFGRINERFGVVRADALLLAIEHSLQRAVATDGLANALGGDQFLVTVVGNPDPSKLAEGLLRTVRRTTLTTRLGYRVRVSATAGVARWPDDGTSGGDLIAAADAALRHAKSTTASGTWSMRDRSDRFGAR